MGLRQATQLVGRRRHEPWVCRAPYHSASRDEGPPLRCRWGQLPCRGGVPVWPLCDWAYSDQGVSSPRSSGAGAARAPCWRTSETRLACGRVAAASPVCRVNHRIGSGGRSAGCASAGLMAAARRAAPSRQSGKPVDASAAMTRATAYRRCRAAKGGGPGRVRGADASADTGICPTSRLECGRSDLFDRMYTLMTMNRVPYREACASRGGCGNQIPGGIDPPWSCL